MTDEAFFSCSCQMLAKEKLESYIQQEMECCRYDAVLQSPEDRNCMSCPDSGYREMQCCSKQAKTTDAIYDILESFSLDCSPETPNENFTRNIKSKLLFNTPKKAQPKNTVRAICLEKDPKRNDASLFETPKNDDSFQRRLLSKAANNCNTSQIKSLDTDHVIFSGASTVEDNFTDLLDFPEYETLASNTLKTDKLVLLCRKKCLMFPKVKTYSLQYGKHEAAYVPSSSYNSCVSELCKASVGMRENIIPCPLTPELLGTPCHTVVTLSTEGSFQTPVNGLDTSLADCRILGTSPHDEISSMDTFSWEDSGFGTGLDGSFQELLLHSASRNKDSLNQGEPTLRSRLENGPSTLRDERSESEEAIAETESTPGHLQPELNIRKVCIGGKHDNHFLEKTVPETSSDADPSLVPALQVVHAKFRWCAMLAGQKDLELLKSSEGTQPLRKTVPLVGLIGKKMGLERLDILSELRKRNLRHIFTMILNMLPCEDICRFGQVSDVWNEMVVQDKMAFQRRRSFLKMQQMSLELGTVPDAASRLNRPCRSPLMPVQAQAKTPHLHTPLPGNGSFTIVKHGVKHSASKREEFLQVAKTLFNDECLRPCPRCQHPARCHSVKREGVCSSGDCGFHFCTWCLCAYHGSKDCGGSSFKHYDRKEVLAGSTQSKHNLRRL